MSLEVSGAWRNSPRLTNAACAEVDLYPAGREFDRLSFASRELTRRPSDAKIGLRRMFHRIEQRDPISDNPEVAPVHALVEREFAELFRKAPRSDDGKYLFPRRPALSHLEETYAYVARFLPGSLAKRAALAHDLCEDIRTRDPLTGRLVQAWTLDDIERTLGRRERNVLFFVTQDDKNMSWMDRNRLARAKLIEAARIATDPEIAATTREEARIAIYVHAGSTVSNIQSNLRWLRAGYPVDTVTKKDWLSNLKKYCELGAIYRQVLEPRAYTYFEANLRRFNLLARELELKITTGEHEVAARYASEN